MLTRPTGAIAFPFRDRRLQVSELSPEEIDIVLETRLSASMKLRTFLFVQSETPGKRAAVLAQFSFDVATGGVKFLHGTAKPAERGPRAKDLVGGFPFHFNARQPVRIASLPGLLNFVPETFSNRAEIPASIWMQVLNQPPVDRLRFTGERRFASQG